MRFLSENITKKSVVEKVLVNVLERFKSKISSLEESKDFSKLTLIEVVNAFQASKHRTTIRMDSATETALCAKVKGKASIDSTTLRKTSSEFKERDKKPDYSTKLSKRKAKFLTCFYCKKKNHAKPNCWFNSKAKCKTCNRRKHIGNFCKNTSNSQKKNAKAANQVEVVEEHLFVASCCRETKTSQRLSFTETN